MCSYSLWFFYTKIVASCWTTINRRMLDPTKKEIPCIQGQRRSPNKMVGGTQSHFKSNLRPARDNRRAQTKPCVHQDWGKGAATPTRDWARLSLSVWVSPAEAWVPVTCHGDLGGTACGLGPLGGGAVIPTTEPQSRQPPNWRTIISKKFLHCCKGSRAHKDFPTWGSSKSTENPQGNRLLQGTTECTRTQRKEQWPHERLSHIACDCLGVFGGGVGWQWPA